MCGISVYYGNDQHFGTTFINRANQLLAHRGQVEKNGIELGRTNKLDDIWNESFFGVHLPHLVNYDDRNAMARSIEGRMPFLDRRLAELLSQYQSGISAQFVSNLIELKYMVINFLKSLKSKI